MTIFNRISNLYFFTATNLNWQKALESESRKQMIVDAMSFLVKDKRVHIFAFVIMPNHIHILWESLLEDNDKMKMLIQGSLLKFTSKNILLAMSNSEKQSYLVEDKDRKYQIWERNPLWIECFHKQTAEQKLSYIHSNPCAGKWQLSEYPSNYHYSTASFYEDGVDSFGFLTGFFDYY